jgi:hypothetical protein
MEHASDLRIAKQATTRSRNAALIAVDKGKARFVDI